ncbi:hypothetical protein [Nostoc sp. CENA543]|uniref:hypothetical protein n=1 Tax=Nostoc sp. CENA543 TaxID=1869241 RepID=UPI0012FFF917|nr:hypothetical protein [Nostoc sp. CENA543]
MSKQLVKSLNEPIAFDHCPWFILIFVSSGEVLLAVAGRLARAVSGSGAFSPC